MPEQVSNPLLTIAPQERKGLVDRAPSSSSDHRPFHNELDRAQQSTHSRSKIDDNSEQSRVSPESNCSSDRDDEQFNGQDGFANVVVVVANEVDQEELIVAADVDDEGITQARASTIVMEQSQTAGDQVISGVEFASAEVDEVIANEESLVVEQGKPVSVEPIVVDADDSNRDSDVKGSHAITEPSEPSDVQPPLSNDDIELQSAATPDDSEVYEATSTAKFASSVDNSRQIEQDRESVSVEAQTIVELQPQVEDDRMVAAISTENEGSEPASDKQRESTTKPDQHTSATSSLTDRAGRFVRQSAETSESIAPRLTTAEASRFVGRVSKAFQSAQDNGGVVKLRLSPPELGALRIELSVSKGALSARLETENPAARAILLDNLPALRERLAEQQIRIDHFNVDVGGGQHDGAPDWESASEQRHAKSRHPVGRQSSSPSEEANEVSSRSITANSDGRFNAIA